MKKRKHSGIRGMYDPYTDKIINCEKGSLVYWHEKGHQDWFKKGYETETQTYAILLFFGAISVIGIKLVPLSLWFIIPAWTLFIVNELHAWYYAFKNYKR